MLRLFFAIPGKIKAALGILGAVIVAVGIAFLKGRAAGIRHIEAEQDRRRLEAIRKRKESDDEVAGMDGAVVDHHFDRWMRDSER